MTSGSSGIWQLFVQGLISQGLVALDPQDFKAAGALTIADWEVIDYSGLMPPSAPLGTVITDNVYGWADPMPLYQPLSYQPGGSLYDQYCAFVNDIEAHTPGDQSTVAHAQQALAAFKMTDSGGNTLPGYAISPSLNTFLQASLQSYLPPAVPQLSFRITVPGMPTTAAASAPSVGSDIPFFAYTEGANAAVAVQLLSPPVGAGVGTQQPAVEILFQAQSLQLFIVRPAPWFNAALLSDFASSLAPGSALQQQTLFGPNGVLSLRTSAILVAFRRTVTVQGPSGQLRAFRDLATLSTPPIVSLGAFHFDLQAPSTLTLPSGDTVVFQDNTDAPYVIGVAVTLLGPRTQ